MAYVWDKPSGPAPESSDSERPSRDPISVFGVFGIPLHSGVQGAEPPVAGAEPLEIFSDTSAPSSLDTQQTKPSFRAKTFRTAVEAELLGADLWKQADRWGKCGSPQPLYCGDCGHSKQVKFYCELQLCASCASRSSKKIVKQLSRAVRMVKSKPGYQWVMLTLTLKPTGSVADDLKRGKKCWEKYRNRLRRRHKGIGGWAAWEVGANRNVHLHTLAFLPYLPQEKIADEWEKITGDSRVCDIRAAYGPGGMNDAIKEVAKYITKLGNGRNAKELVEIYLAFKGKPRGRAWGCLRGLMKAAKEPDAPEELCEKCGSSNWITPEGLEWLMREWERGPPSDGSYRKNFLPPVLKDVRRNSEQLKLELAA